MTNTHLLVAELRRLNPNSSVLRYFGDRPAPPPTFWERVLEILIGARHV